MLFLSEWHVDPTNIGDPDPLDSYVYQILQCNVVFLSYHGHLHSEPTLATHVTLFQGWQSGNNIHDPLND